MLVKTLRTAEGPALGKYDDTELGSLEGFNDETAYGKLDGFLLVARTGLVDRLKLGTDLVTEICFWEGKLLGTTIGSIHTWRI